MKLIRHATLSLILGTATMCCFCGLPGFTQSSNPHAISLYNLGLTAYKQGSPESAIIFFKRACDIDPSLADAQYNLGVLYQSQKRLKEAAPRFQEVLKVKPNDPDAHYQLGLVLIDLGQLAEAKQHLSSIPPSDRHFADAQKRLSVLDSQITQSSAPTAPNAITSALPPTQPLTTDGIASSQTAGQGGYETSYAPPSTSTIQGIPQSQLSSALPSSNQPLVQANQDPQLAPATASASARSYAAQASSQGPVPILANTSIRVIATGFSAPAGLAFDRLGNLYVANFLSNSVDRISPDGSRSQFSVGSNLKGPIGLVADAAGNIYVANYVGGTIARINPAGISNVVATGFKKPYYLTLDHDGNLFVSQQEDNSIVRMTLPKSLGTKVQ